MSLLGLFFVFLYVGTFAIGGGMVAATFMKQALVDQYGLITAEKFYSMLAISESTPGPIGINVATYIGTELHGWVGGIVCTVGEVLPSLVIIVIIARTFSKFRENSVAKSVFTALRPATSGMVCSVLASVFSMAVLNVPAFSASRDLKILFNWPCAALYCLCLLLLFKIKKMHPVFVVVLGGIFGAMFL